MRVSFGPVFANEKGEIILGFVTEGEMRGVASFWCFRSLLVSSAYYFNIIK